MSTELSTYRPQFVEYDSLRRRVWILGQRCHHGATGSIVTVLACLGLAVQPAHLRAMVTAAAAGSALMAHDWKDHTIWFERGRGTQP